MERNLEEHAVVLSLIGNRLRDEEAARILDHVFAT